MNFGPLEFGAYLRRSKEARQEESAQARDAPAIAPARHPQENLLTIVSGPGQLMPPLPDAQSGAVGVYEVIADQAALAAARPVRVLVQPALLPVVLVLSSQQSLHWWIELMPGAELLWVLLAGSDARASGVAPERVSCFSGSSERSSREFQQLEQEVMRCTGRHIEHFQSLRACDVIEVGGPHE